MTSQPSRPPLSRRAKAIGTLVLVAGGAVMGLLLVLLLIRLFPNLEPGGQRYFFTDLDGDTFRHQPGLVRPPQTNRVLEDGTRYDDADGFRRPARTADHYPIAIIGDSFTDGGQVPWTDYLAAELNTPVRNLGWSGFGPLEYAEIADRYLASDHQWVLVAYFEGNDLSNIQTTRRAADANGGVVPLNLTRTRAQPITDLRQLEAYNDITLDPQGRYLYPLTHTRRDGSTFEMAYISDYLWWLNGGQPAYAESRNAEELRAVLDRIREAANGACVGLVYIPAKEHIYIPYADPDGNRKFVYENARRLVVGDDGWLTHLPPEPTTYEESVVLMDSQRDVVRQIALNSDWAFIDLLPPFNLAAETQLTYYPYDSHWSDEGHRLAAQTVATYIEEHPCAARPS